MLNFSPHVTNILVGYTINTNDFEGFQWPEVRKRES
jgi:hypothetical protein